MANRRAAGRVLGCGPIGDGLVSLRLRARPVGIAIVQVCAPASSAADDVVDGFCSRLRDALDAASERDAVFVVGDFGAEIGAGRCRGGGCCWRVWSGGRWGGDNLVDLCVGGDLVVAGALFRRHPGRLCAWQGPGGRTGGRVGFILVGRRWGSSVGVSGALPGADVGGDHRPVCGLGWRGWRRSAERGGLTWGASVIDAVSGPETDFLNFSGLLRRRPGWLVAGSGGHCA